MMSMRFNGIVTSKKIPFQKLHFFIGKVCRMMSLNKSIVIDFKNSIELFYHEGIQSIFLAASCRYRN